MCLCVCVEGRGAILYEQRVHLRVLHHLLCHRHQLWILRNKTIGSGWASQLGVECWLLRPKIGAVGGPKRCKHISLDGGKTQSRKRTCMADCKRLAIFGLFNCRMTCIHRMRITDNGWIHAAPWAAHMCTFKRNKDCKGLPTGRIAHVCLLLP